MWKYEIITAPNAATQQYIALHPHADYYDSIAPNIAQQLRHKLYIVQAWHNGQLCGIVNALHLQNYIFDRALIATAFGTAHGALWQNHEANAVLLQGLIALGQQLGVPYAQWRLRQPLPEQNLQYMTVPYSIDTMYHNFSGPLVTNTDTLPRKARADVRAAFAQPQLCYDEGDFDAFLWCYRRSMRDLGTPMHARGFYAMLAQQLPHTIAVVRHAGTPLCATLAWHNTTKATIAPYYGGGTPLARYYGGFDRLYFELMQRAATRGFCHVDFGRSKQGTGAYDYKKRRGFNPEPLYYVNLHLNGCVPPALNPLNPKFSRAIAVWKKLPLWLVNSAGSFVARELG